jgi:hypothetical protein
MCSIRSPAPVIKKTSHFNIEIFHLNIMTLLGQSTTDLQITKGRHLSCLLSPRYFSHPPTRRHDQSIETKRLVLINVTAAMLRVTFQCVLQF